MVKVFTLNNGKQMPSIGLGTWKAEPEVVGKAVRTAISNGYRHIDGAFIYQNEKEIGVAYEEIFSGPNAKVKREDVFITSKLWNNSHLPEDVLPALESTLKDLRLDYLDLYLMHWPVGWSRDSVPSPYDENMKLKLEDVTINQTWEAMEKLLETGKVRSIGVSNFNITRIKDLLTTAKVVPAVNQVEIHPYLVQEDLAQFCKEKNILLTAYSAFGSGGEPKLLDDPKINEIAKKYGKKASQVILAWLVQRGISVIPKSSNEERIKENLDVDFTLSEEDMHTLSHIGTNHRFLEPMGEFGFNPFIEQGQEGFVKL